jgi:hypothetical protein
MTDWHVSHEHLSTLMGPGATGADAEDMADLLTNRGYETTLTEWENTPLDWRPVPDEVWDECILALVAVHAR